jgi:hypothetical protein
VVRALSGAALAFVSVPLLAATPPPQEHEVKAAFLYHFAQLVTGWPEPAAAEPFVIAVAGPDPFGPALEAALADKSVRGQPVRLQRFRTASALEGARVHVLFVAGDDEDFAARALAAVSGQAVLTVGEAEGFAERGGMIGFRVTRDGRVAFDINPRRAEKAGLRMSSQLLKLARIVGEAPSGAR